MQEPTVVERYQAIQAKIEQTEKASGRSLDSEKVCLIAVSKNHSAEKIRELYQAGVRVFGENRVQEMTAKCNELADLEIEWHFIGHLQRNKVRKLLSLHPSLIQSVDNEALAEVLEKEAARIEEKVSILVELNIGLEESKTGLAPDRAIELVRWISDRCPHLWVKGLMCVAPEREDLEEVRPYFRQLKMIAKTIENEALLRVSMKELSMGMSHDFSVAIEEGATMVRVGTAIFGQRDYSFQG